MPLFDAGHALVVDAGIRAADEDLARDVLDGLRLGLAERGDRLAEHGVETDGLGRLEDALGARVALDDQDRVGILRLGLLHVRREVGHALGRDLDLREDLETGVARRVLAPRSLCGGDRQIDRDDEEPLLALLGSRVRERRVTSPVTALQRERGCGLEVVLSAGGVLADDRDPRLLEDRIAHRLEDVEVAHDGRDLLLDRLARTLRRAVGVALGVAERVLDRVAVDPAGLVDRLRRRLAGGLDVGVVGERRANGADRHQLHRRLARRGRLGLRTRSAVTVAAGCGASRHRDDGAKRGFPLQSLHVHFPLLDR